MVVSATDEEEFAMKYLMLVCGDEAIQAPPDIEPNTVGWLEEMEGRGVRLTGDALRPVSDATTVRVRNGEVLLSDGPFAETKEQILGFDILDASDLDEAIEIASKHPVARYGCLEIRPFR
jgi:hypothetical protein